MRSQPKQPNLVEDLEGFVKFILWAALIWFGAVPIFIAIYLSLTG